MHFLSLENRELPYRNESTQKPPQAVKAVVEVSANFVLSAALQNTATVWRGDFHNAKQVLSALKKKVRKPAKSGATAAESFHKHRLAQAQQSRIINMLLVEIGEGFTLNLPRSPNVFEALRDVYGEENETAFLLPLNQLLGFIGAHEWHKKGVEVAAAGGRVCVPFGVFSPIRGEYLSLLEQAPLPSPCKTAWDIGTGSGVLAAIMAKRGISHILATDNNPKAVLCAKKNIENLGFTSQVQILQRDFFPDGQADLIVCNPPWLPAKPTSVVESALYDPNSAMLKGVLSNAAARLNENGQLWLIMSDLAEHLGLRQEGELQQWIADAGWEIEGVDVALPKHQKASNVDDPLAFARMKEKTYLFRMRKKEET